MRIARFRRVFLPLLAALWAMAPVQTGAQQLSAPVLAIIDVQKVLRDSTAVQALSRQIADRKVQHQDELREQERSLREADQELNRQRTILSPEAYAKKRGELEKQVATLQREAQNRKRGLDKIFAEGMGRVQAEINKIAAEFVEERGLDLILSKTTVVQVKPEFELTQEAVRRLNNRLPDLAAAQPQN